MLGQGKASVSASSATSNVRAFYFVLLLIRRNCMPRLEGPPSNTARNVLILLILLTIILVVLEFTGIINLIPGFGSS